MRGCRTERGAMMADEQNEALMSSSLLWQQLRLSSFPAVRNKLSHPRVPHFVKERVTKKNKNLTIHPDERSICFAGCVNVWCLWQRARSPSGSWLPRWRTGCAGAGVPGAPPPSRMRPSHSARHSGSSWSRHCLLPAGWLAVNVVIGGTY